MAADLTRLEQEYHDAIARLPQKHALTVNTYVAALRVKIKDQEEQMGKLADRICELDPAAEVKFNA